MVSLKVKTMRMPEITTEKGNIIIEDNGEWSICDFSKNMYKGKSALPAELDIFENKNPTIWSQLLFQEKLSNWNYIPISSSLSYEISKKFYEGKAEVKGFTFYCKSEYPDVIIRDYIRDCSFEAFLTEPFGKEIEIKLVPFIRVALTTDETIVIPKSYDDFIQEAADVRQYFSKFSSENFLTAGHTIILNERKWIVDSRLNLIRV